MLRHTLLLKTMPTAKQTEWWNTTTTMAKHMEVSCYFYELLKFIINAHCNRLRPAVAWWSNQGKGALCCGVCVSMVGWRQPRWVVGCRFSGWLCQCGMLPFAQVRHDLSILQLLPWLYCVILDMSQVIDEIQVPELSCLEARVTPQITTNTSTTLLPLHHSLNSLVCTKNTRSYIHTD